MRDDEIGQVGLLQQSAVRFGCPNESLGDDRCSRDSPRFQLRAVVETPRRARASIADAVDDGLAVARQGSDQFRRCALAGFGLLRAHHPNALVALLQPVLEPVEHFAGVVLVIVEEPDDGR